MADVQGPLQQVAGVPTADRRCWSQQPIRAKLMRQIIARCNVWAARAAASRILPRIDERGRLPMPPANIEPMPYGEHDAGPVSPAVPAASRCAGSFRTKGHAAGLALRTLAGLALLISAAMPGVAAPAGAIPAAAAGASSGKHIVLAAAQVTSGESRVRSTPGGVIQTAEATRTTKPAPPWLKLLRGGGKRCTAEMMKAGTCGGRAGANRQQGGNSTGNTRIRPGGNIGGRGGSFSGGNAASSNTGSPGGGGRVVCVGGKPVGDSCSCPKGTTLRRIRRNAYRCVGVIEPCRRGFVRIGGKCVRIPSTPPPGGGNSGQGGDSSGTDGGGNGYRCIGGHIKKGDCICPPPTVSRRIGRRTFRCVMPQCPSGSVRKGRRCIPISEGDPPPPPPICPPRTHLVGKRCVADRPPGTGPTPEPPHPVCRKGWRLRDGRCVRVISTACPEGTRRRGPNCVSILPPRAPPTRATPGVPVPAAPPRAAAATEDADYEPGEVLVQITSANPQPIANRLVNSFGLTTLSRTQLTAIGVSLYRFAIPAGRSVEAVVADLKREPGVTGSQPNWRYSLNTEARAAATGAREGAASGPQGNGGMPQYALDLVGARKAHGLSRGAGVLVAVIDTGIDESHPELAGSVAARFNAFPAQGFAPDTHGTAIAGIIAAHADLVGIAPEARILAVQAFSPKGGADGGRGTSQRIAAGLNWAMMKGARVINMSFAGRNADEIVEALIGQAARSGLVLVAAAGNAGRGAPAAYPAAYPAVIAVTAVDEARGLYANANVGSYVTIAAPGVGIMAPAAGKTYDIASGTSFAAAHVSGIAALMLAGAAGLAPDRITERLKVTAEDLGAPGPDEEFGAGLAQALKALEPPPMVDGAR